jgi:hypothetical protein
MSPWRLARIAGAVLVLGTLCCGCGLLAVARPTHPYYDVEAQQADFLALEMKVLVFGGLLVAAGVALGVYGGIRESRPFPPPPAEPGRESGASAGGPAS